MVEDSAVLAGPWQPTEVQRLVGRRWKRRRRRREKGRGDWRQIIRGVLRSGEGFLSEVK